MERINKQFQILLITFFGMIAGLQAQSTFQKTIGGDLTEHLWDLEKVDGGYLAVGQTTSFGFGSADAYVVKLNEDGDTVWTSAVGGSSSEYAVGIHETVSGQFLLAGHTYSFGDESGDAYLVKIDIDGSIVWSKSYGGESNEDITDVIRNYQSSGHIVLGSTYSFGAGGWDMWLINVDGSGDAIWTKTYGGEDIDEAYAICKTQDGNFMVAGRTTSFGDELGDAVLMKVDFNGDLLWSKTYGGTGAEVFHDVIAVEGNSFIAVGMEGSFADDSDRNVFVIKVDEFGNTIWSKSIGGDGNDVARDIELTAEGDVLITGETFAFGDGVEMFMTKLNDEGETIWYNTYGGSADEWGRSIAIDDQTYIVGGITSSFEISPFDFYIVKTDSTGYSDCNFERFTPNNSDFDLTISDVDLIVYPIDLETVTAESQRNYGAETLTLCSDFSSVSESLDEIKIRIYPNPASNEFRLVLPKEMNSSKDVQILLTDPRGSHIFMPHKSYNGEIVMDVSSLSRGIYSVSVIIHEEIFHQTLVLQ